MSNLTYFRVGVPKDMVADIMWNEDFYVSMEPIVLRTKPETNYQRYFGNSNKVVVARIETPHDGKNHVRVTWSGTPVYIERPVKIGWCARLIEWLESEVQE